MIAYEASQTLLNEGRYISFEVENPRCLVSVPDGQHG